MKKGAPIALPEYFFYAFPFFASLKYIIAVITITTQRIYFKAVGEIAYLINKYATVAPTAPNPINANVAFLS